ncbi:Uncharacterised protein [Gemella morbillorum]|jgi:hypothetical protein|uniref:hypothetical protein n=1 Tax=Gemella morbillorum TaxID=29391 RepID=UPI000DA40984|nr:hypothetical protein [Gemella morbillorum]UBH81417.1 hypothetical protein LA320_03725 [Gemella morbillorum]SQH55187.1 Uncharacterised protein [Gemella morbillorum]
MIGNKERISLSLFLFGVLIGTILMASNSFVFKKENEELKIQNHKLEQKLLKLYEEQAEQTKRTAERNGVGG